MTKKYMIWKTNEKIRIRDENMYDGGDFVQWYQ